MFLRDVKFLLIKKKIKINLVRDILKIVDLEDIFFLFTVAKTVYNQNIYIYLGNYCLGIYLTFINILHTYQPVLIFQPSDVFTVGMIRNFTWTLVMNHTIITT